jgi:uncharacterized membrane protein (DUF106 family)
MLQPPLSTLMLTFTAVAFAFISNLLTKRFVDLEAERRIKAEIDQWNRALKEAIKNKDKKEEEKLRKKEQTIAQMRLKMSSARTKVGFITIIPFFAIYYLIVYIVGNVPVAYSPVYIPYLMTSPLPNGGYDVTLFGWYLISSFAFSGMITRLMKTTT